jgi:tetratricopeptide (TPR) repeat protein
MNQNLRTAALIAALVPMLLVQGCNRAQRRARARAQAAANMPAPAPSEADQARIRAEILKGQGLDQVALAEFERAIAINPKLTPAYIGMAEIHRKLGDLPKAEQAYGKAATLEPQNFEAQYNHGLMLQLLDRVAEAVRAYIRALQIKPNDFEANLNLATAYLQLSEPGAALPYAQRAVSLNGQSGPARVNLGAVYTALGDHEAAVVEYQQAAELMELTPELLLNLADALGRIGRYAEMQNTLEQLIRLSPTPVAYERLATAHFKQRRYDEALASFRKSLELDQNYYPALNGVGVSLLNRYLLSEKQDIESLREGITALRRSIQIERRQPAVVELIARYG